MRRLWTKCPKCGSKNVSTSSTVAIIRNFTDGKLTNSYQNTTDAMTTWCRDCKFEEMN